MHDYDIEIRTIINKHYAQFRGINNALQIKLLLYLNLSHEKYKPLHINVRYISSYMQIFIWCLVFKSLYIRNLFEDRCNVPYPLITLATLSLWLVQKLNYFDKIIFIAFIFSIAMRTIKFLLEAHFCNFIDGNLFVTAKLCIKHTCFNVASNLLLFALSSISARRAFVATQ